jgi:hypothetical protein
LEEYRPQLPTGIEESDLSVALEKTRALLQSTLGSDEELADVASDTDPRAMEKVRGFLRVLSDNNAVCALEYGQSMVRFQTVSQVQSSLARLEADNLHERQEVLTGAFEGALPNARTFEFKLAENGQILRGKVASNVEAIDQINEYRYVQVQISVTVTQVGNGRPRYVLTRLPQWRGVLAP